MAAPLVRFGIAMGAFSGAVPGRDEVTLFARKAEAVGFDSVQVEIGRASCRERV